MRSNANERDVETWVEQLDPSDPNVETRDGMYLRHIGEAMSAVEDAEERLRQAVADARAHGESWALIGMVLGVSKQAAQQRFGSA